MPNYGFIITTVPKGSDKTLENMFAHPAIFASSQEVIDHYKSQQDYDLVGIVPLTLLESQIALIKNLAKENGIILESLEV